MPSVIILATTVDIWYSKTNKNTVIEIVSPLQVMTEIMQKFSQEIVTITNDLVYSY